jgi:hypothetical protein
VTLPAGKFKGLDAALADRCDLQVAIFGRNGYGKPLIGRKAGFGHLPSIWRGIGRLALISINRINPLRMPRECQTGNEAAVITMLSLFLPWIHGRDHFARGAQEHVEKWAKPDFRQLSQELHHRVTLRA